MPSQDEVEEFAALLRRLKARTDRSYAALARRLNMNASTLHRYCTGDTVPLGFAPVERFAVLCEASTAERIELHRRWVLAVAARQRPRTEDAAARPAGIDDHAADEAAELVPEEAAEPAAAPRQPWPRRRAAVVAAVVTATIATVGGLSLLPSGHSRAAGDHKAAGTAAPRTAGAPYGSPTPPSAAAPLTWSANSQLWETGCDHDYVIDKAPPQVPPPPAPQDAGSWALAQGAVHGGRTLVDITVQGRTEAAVVLEALRVRVVGRAAPVKGTVYATGQGCGSDMTPRSFAVDLDKGRPIARPVPGSENGTSTPAMPMPYRVSSKDPEALLVDARTAGCDCRWYLELDWSSQGRTGTERIDDRGRPFRTSGIRGLPHYWYASNGWTPITG
ncbi:MULTISPECIES: helix-turn-helix domain-containing protein [unclassified Streptomyces]|uniref:helix-turn-helix domain-containing protein n=1 Tax=unclassified Streptomyces TaxID=2593676 RepID=UPI00381570F1